MKHLELIGEVLEHEWLSSPAIGIVGRSNSRCVGGVAVFVKWLLGLGSMGHTRDLGGKTRFVDGSLGLPNDKG